MKDLSKLLAPVAAGLVEEEKTLMKKISAPINICDNFITDPFLIAMSFGQINATSNYFFKGCVPDWLPHCPHSVPGQLLADGVDPTRFFPFSQDIILTNVLFSL